MVTVFKYPFKPDDLVKIGVPLGAEIVHVDEQDGVLCAWCMVDTEAKGTEIKTMRMAGTGRPLGDVPHISFINTVLARNGLVWHFFEVA